MSPLLRQLPNIITALRIVGTAALLLIEPFSAPFIVVYTLSGVSDVLDGWIARKFRLSSDLGAKLDSAADLLFYSVMIIRIFPVLWAELPRWIWNLVFTVVAIRLASYATAAIRFRRFASLHTYMNKLTGLIIFALPYVIKTAAATPYCIFLAIVSGFGSLEELIMHATAKEYDPSRHSLFTH